MKENTIKAIIIDDEELARKVVVNYLAQHPEIEIVAECDNGFTGLKAINEMKPHLLFLDIQMPKINGFELLELMDEKPLIIFSTAHDEYALKAFELSALDYLLKPYSRKRFAEAVQKAIGRIQSGAKQDDALEKLNNDHENREDYLRRIVVKNGTHVQIIPAEEVLWIEAADDYVEIYTKNSKYLKQKPLSFFESALDPDSFIRVHRSTIVAISEISKLEPYSKDSYVVILKNGKEVNVSKTGMSALKERLNF